MTHNKVQAEFKEKPQIKMSLNLLRNNAGAQYILGRPIKDFKIDLSDDKAVKKSDKENDYKIPVSGPSGNGFYYIYTTVEDGMWTVNKSELEVKTTTELEPEKYKDRRLLIYSREKHGELEKMAEKS